MTAANALNIPSIGPISNTATGTFSSSYNKFYQPGYANVGIAFSGTTFTVQSEGGTAMSSTNPGFIALQSLANPGQIKRYSVTANQTFTQAGLGNNLFGVTTAVNITVDIPFYLYAVSNANNGENAIAFMISRVPHRTIAPVAGNIGQSGNTLASTQGSFFSLATITAADYASSPCLCIGSFRMRYSSSLWTVQTINNSDGIAQYQEGIQFSFPRGQFGAASGKYFLNNTGTAPDQTTGASVYFINKTGFCMVALAFPVVDVAGVGAVALDWALPFTALNGGIGIYGNFEDGTNTIVFTGALSPGSSATLRFRYQSLPGNSTVLNSNIPLNTEMSIGGTYFASTA
jgi:hypothetical protein